MKIPEASDQEIEGDLYLLTLDHQRYLNEKYGQPLQSPEYGAQQFVEEKE